MSLKGSLPLSEKYRPHSLEDLIGSRHVIEKVLNWLKQWPNVAHRGFLLVGSAGSGKTSLVHALAHDFGFVLIEVNASDFRNKDAIQRIIGVASQYQGFNSESHLTKTMILVDEVDGISGTYDRGGLASLKKILKISRVPIFLTANDIESDKLAVLDSLVEKVIVQRPCEPTIYFLLKRINEHEGFTLNKSVLRQIAQYSMGDFRASINDLESYVTSSSFVPSSRDQAFTLLETLQNIFSSSSLAEAQKASRSFSSSDYSSLLAYILEIVSIHVTDPSLRLDLLESIAHADLFLNRIRRTGYWSLLKYFFFDISAKIGYYLQKHDQKIEFSSLEFPSRFKYLGQRKRILGNRLRLAEQVQSLFHTSRNKIVHEIFPFLEVIALNDPERGAEILAWLNFSDEDVVSFFSKKQATKILPFMENARKLVDLTRIHHVDEDELGDSSLQLDSFLQHETEVVNDDSTNTLDSSLSENVVTPSTRDSTSSVPLDDSSLSSEEPGEHAQEPKGQKTLDDFF